MILGQRPQRLGQGWFVDNGIARFGKPRRPLNARRRLVALSALARSPHTDGPVSYHAIEPCYGLSGRFFLPNQLQERFLNTIVRRGCPLRREQLQRRCVFVEQAFEQLWRHLVVHPRVLAGASTNVTLAVGHFPRIIHKSREYASLRSSPLAISLNA